MRCVRFVGGKGKRMSKRDNTGQSEIMLKVGEDLAELHLRREIERMADKARERCIYVCNGLVYKEGHYYYKQYISTGHGEREDLQGPYTLQQCHDKLREISGEVL
jgi:hypothetical protein